MAGAGLCRLRYHCGNSGDQENGVRSNEAPSRVTVILSYGQTLKAPAVEAVHAQAMQSGQTFGVMRFPFSFRQYNQMPRVSENFDLEVSDERAHVRQFRPPTSYPSPREM